MAKKVIKDVKPESHTCGECAKGEVYWSFPSLSIKGEPTMKTCPLYEYKRLLSEKACVEFETKGRNKE